jgi:hypothetical protein
LRSSEIRMRFDGTLSWSSGTPSVNDPDLLLNRDAANTLALRNGTNAQAFRVYNTFTSATDFERGNIFWDSNVLKIGTEKAGTGTARALEFQTDGTTKFTIRTGSETSLWGSSSGSSSTQYRVSNNSGDFYFAIDNSIGGTFSAGNYSRVLYSSGAYPLVFFTNGVERGSFTSDGLFALAGKTSSFPALKRSSAILQARLADDSGYTTIDANHRLQGTAPASAAATGTAGDIRYDADYIYICTATDTWKRVAIATWP